MKIVADTMLWVSFCTATKGFRRRLIERAHRSRVRIFVSDYILEELVDTLLEDFDFTPRLARMARRSVERLAKAVRVSSPKAKWVHADPDDDPIVQTALTAKADYLVTGDSALLALGQVESVRIISERELADLLAPKNPRR